MYQYLPTKGSFFGCELSTRMSVLTFAFTLLVICIIYSMQKPEKIGYDVRDVLKSLDFGLSQELRPEEMFEDGTHKLTGFTGTICYMLPKVAQS